MPNDDADTPLVWEPGILPASLTRADHLRREAAYLGPRPLLSFPPTKACAREHACTY